MHFLLIYEYSNDYLERRGAFRTEHLQRAWQAHDAGQLLLGGVLNDPADSAALVFTVDSAEQVKAFVKNDPYYQNGLITSYKILPWSTVIGELASQPVRPA